MNVYEVDMVKAKWPFQGRPSKLDEKIRFSDIPALVCPYCGQSPEFRSQPDTYLVKCVKCGFLC